MGELKDKAHKHFEDIEPLRVDFTKVTGKAMIACNNSSHDGFGDFAEVSKIVNEGVTSKPVKDYLRRQKIFRKWKRNSLPK